MTHGTLGFEAEVPGVDWRVGSRDEAVAAGSELVLFHSSTDAFASNITVTSHVYEQTTDLAGVAQAQVASLAETAERVDLLAREETGSSTSPGLLQLLSFSTPVNGRLLRLTQCQVLLAAVDAKSSGQRMVVYMLCLTAEKDAMPALEEDFEHFVSEFRVRQEAHDG